MEKTEQKKKRKIRKTSRKTLTMKQRKFVKVYLETGNASEAIRQSYDVTGDSAKAMSSVNLANPLIRNAIETAASKLGINPEYVLKNFKDIADFSKQKRLKLKKVGKKFVEQEEMVDSDAAIRSTELLGKHLKLFTEQLDVTASVTTETSRDQQINLAKKIALLLQKPIK